MPSRRLCATRAAKPPRGYASTAFPIRHSTKPHNNHIARPQPNCSAGKAGDLEKPAPLMRIRATRASAIMIK
eukprot:10749227-Alexandrium_andersonii.AAC.1